MSEITLSRKQTVLAIGAVGGSLASKDMRGRMSKETLLRAAKLMKFALEEVDKQGLAAEGTIGNLLELGEYLAQALKETDPTNTPMQRM